MNQKFSPLFSLSISHEYFVGSICRNCCLVPFPTSEIELKKYELLLRSFQNQTQLYAAMPPDFQTTDWKERLAAIPDLFFYLQVSDPNFLNYSDLPLEITPSQTYYFTNQPKTEQLQQGAFVSSQDQLTHKSMRFNIDLPQQSKIQFVLNDAQGKQLITQELDGTKQNSYLVDVNPWGQGLYEVEINGKLALKLLALQKDLPEQALGVIQIKTNNLVESLAAGQTMNYALQFQTRSSFWEYTVVLASNRSIEVLEMGISTSEGQAYTGPVKDNTLSGEEANIYTSPEQLALQEEPTAAQSLKMQYKNQYSSRKTALEMTMPYPTGTSLRTEMGTNGQLSYFSNQIVYV